MTTDQQPSCGVDPTGPMQAHFNASVLDATLPINSRITINHGSEIWIFKGVVSTIDGDRFVLAHEPYGSVASLRAFRIEDVKSVERAHQIIGDRR